MDNDRGTPALSVLKIAANKAQLHLNRVWRRSAGYLSRPSGYRRLFRDSVAEELRYFRKYGFFPVMHIIAIKRELIDRRPELAPDIFNMFEEAKRIAYEYYDDSDYSLIVWSRNHYESQRAMLGMDPWVNGFQANRNNLASFLEYAHDQRLTRNLMQPEALFHVSTLDT